MFFVNRKLSATEVDYVNKTGEHVFVSNEEFSLGIAEFEIVKVDDQLVEEQALEITLEFGFQEIEQKRIYDYFIRGTVSLWYMSRYTFFFRMKKYLTLLKQFEIVKKEVKVIYTNETILIRRFEKQGFEFIRPERGDDKKSSKVTVALITGIVFFLRLVLSIPQWIIFFIKKPNLGILYITNNKQKMRPMKKQKAVFGDHYIYYLLEKIRGKKSVVFISEYIFTSLSNSGETPKIKRNSIIDSFYFKCINFDSILFLNLFNVKFYKERKKLKETLLFLESRISTKSEDSFLFVEVMKTMNGFYGYCCFRATASNIFFKLTNLKKIVLCGEHDPHGKALIEGAKLNNCKSIAIQHGSVFYGHIGYTFSSKYDENVSKPDKTILWGNKWRRELLRCGYASSELQVIGQLRADLVQRLKKDVVKKDVPRILYASQPLREGEEEKRNKLLGDIVMLAKLNKDYEVVVKPHPREKDFVYFEKQIQEFKLKNISLDTSDLYLQLALSDVVIVYFSTVGAEAISFKKDLIVLDYEQRDVLGYVKDGVAVGVQNLDQLNTAVNTSVMKGLPISDLTKDEFVLENVGSVSGDVSGQYINYIDCIN